MPPHGMLERGLSNNRLALVPKSVEVTVNAGPLGNWWLDLFFLWEPRPQSFPYQILLEILLFLLSFPKLELLISKSHTWLSFRLEEAQNRGSEIRGAVHGGPKIKAWPSVTYIQSVSYWRSPGHRANQKDEEPKDLVCWAHSGSPVQGGNTGILCTFWCV